MLGICAARAEAEPMKQESKSCAREQELRESCARVARVLRESCARVARVLRKS